MPRAYSNINWNKIRRLKGTFEVSGLVERSHHHDLHHGGRLDEAKCGARLLAQQMDGDMGGYQFLIHLYPTFVFFKNCVFKDF